MSKQHTLGHVLMNTRQRLLGPLKTTCSCCWICRPDQSRSVGFPASSLWSTFSNWIRELYVSIDPPSSFLGELLFATETRINDCLHHVLQLHYLAIIKSEHLCQDFAGFSWLLSSISSSVVHCNIWCQFKILLFTLSGWPRERQAQTPSRMVLKVGSADHNPTEIRGFGWDTIPYLRKSGIRFKPNVADLL